MQSIKGVYKIGMGPSSSHTMGPGKAARIFSSKNSGASSFRVTLYGSLAATGRGHLTDQAVINGLAPTRTEIIWKPEENLPLHPNGMDFEALDSQSTVQEKWRAYSVGGGDIKDDLSFHEPAVQLYPFQNMAEILAEVTKRKISFWQLINEYENKNIWDYLAEIWQAMQTTVQKGLEAEGVLPGGLNLERKANSYYRSFRAVEDDFFVKISNQLFAFSLAAAEENAAGGQVVAAPTCGSSGVLPSVLYYFKIWKQSSDDFILKALATAGLFGNIARTNASISGAEVGCAGEIGVACAMAATAAAQLLGGQVSQIEYAAEIGLEHHLGLTCDPVMGLVQIPCIERNAMASTRALSSAIYALSSSGQHRVSFDQVLNVMVKTGRDLLRQYRETSLGGLAE